MSRAPLSPIVLRTVLLLAVALPMRANANEPMPIVLGIEPDASGAALLLRADGIAVDGCTPDLVAISRRGRELVMSAAPTDVCSDAPQPFSLSSDSVGQRLSSLDDGVYRLRLQLQADPAAEPQLQAFSLVAHGSAAEQPVRPESGFWWGEQGGEFDQAAPGFGVQIEQQAGTLAVAVSGYDDEGQPEWLVGAAPIEGAITRIPLGRLHGGRGPFGRFRSPQLMADAGHLHIEWLGPARAIFWFERPARNGRGIELQPVSMVRFGFSGVAGEQWLGRWLLGGEGVDDAVAARNIDFIAFALVEDGFSLSGAIGERLECMQDPSRPNSPPDYCRLLIDGLEELDFDRVALSQMRGSGNSGRAVMMRVER